jgi:hypothetical protein
LNADADRATLARYTTRIIANLDQRKKGSLERQQIPPRAHFERSLESSERNPADKVALAHVAKLILASDGPVRQPDAVTLYTCVRRRFLLMVKQHHFSELAVPPSDSGRMLNAVRRIITSELPVMAFPYCFERGGVRSWCYALLPDLPTVEASEAARVVGVWYRMLAVEQQPSGELKEQQLRDLEAIVPTGMKPVLQYLVVTLSNPATRRALRIISPSAQRRRRATLQWRSPRPWRRQPSPRRWPSTMLGWKCDGEGGIRCCGWVGGVCVEGAQRVLYYVVRPLRDRPTDFWRPPVRPLHDRPTDLPNIVPD